MTNHTKVPLTLKEAVRPTTVISSVKLNNHLGLTVTLASETFQHTGSFKFRAAYNLALNASAGMILADSSGNFGQALAYSCQLLGKKCTIVMPSTSAAVKIEAVRGFGGTVVLTEVAVKSRKERLQELAKEHPEAFIASAYDHQSVIDGNASLGDEICALPNQFDYIVAPVGGGGLTSGIVQSLQKHNSKTKIIGAEPLLGNDAARSLKAGHIVRNEHEPKTLADGARVLSIGELNWQILRHGLETIIEIPESAIADSMRLLFKLANLKCEPTGALSVAALLTNPDVFKSKSICCVISGGNVDPATYGTIISG